MLERRELALDDALDLVWQLGFDILLETTQQKWTQHLVETFDDEKLLFFIEINLVLNTLIRERCVEPFFKRLDAFEDLGQDKVEQGPEFGQIVLHVI